jgi:U3 small nucleolar RNA-associated protein 19
MTVEKTPEGIEILKRLKSELSPYFKFRLRGRHENRKEVLGAKYRAKFMYLLHVSLKSANLPSYSIAAFIKKLSYLALRVPGPAACFCIAQATWLLRRHPQCQVLIHRPTDTIINDNYNVLEDINLEKANALTSSLWEVAGLQNHYIYEASILAQALENEKSTSANKNIPEISVEMFMKQNYADLIEIELKRIKKSAAFAFQEPKQLLSPESTIASCFGF